MINRAPSPSAITAAEYLRRLRMYLGNRYSDHTAAAFRNQSIMFLREIGVKPGYTRNDVLRFVNLLVKRGYKARSITTITCGVRAMFRAADLEWPLDRRDMHLGLPAEEGGGPVISPQDVRRIIQRARDLDPREAYPDMQLVALATIWGFRNQELAALLSTGLDGEHIELATAKSGRKRVHLIPEALTTVLTFPGRTIGRDGVHYRFDAVMAAVGRKAGPREGWHAFRRAVATGLSDAGLDPYTLHKFMGWKITETGFVYYRPTAAHVDEKVYAVHPFLPEWVRGQDAG